MSKRYGQRTLFDWFRGGSALRVLFLATTLMASQGSLACAFERAFAPQESERSIVSVDIEQSDAATASAEHSRDDCCGLCIDCAYCGGCCSFAVTLRASAAHLSFAPIAYASISFATVAPKLWTPPTLLRPPINAA
jgi:hypothetical protein